MKDFTEMLMENGMVAQLPAEYLDHLQTEPKPLAFRDPETPAEVQLATKTKGKMLALFAMGAVILLLLFGYVIATRNKWIVILLLGFMAAVLMFLTVRTARIRPQVATGRAVAKQRARSASAGRSNRYAYYVSIAVDEPEKAIHSRIPVSKKVYDRVEQGMTVCVENITRHGFLQD